ncbi:MAG TPA: AAA family ATPase [Bryobacteraceae bacterium]|nr:AAA family ATPase [Bryobacteraceae bacterium]
MIREIKISGFKSFESVDLTLGTLNIFIGTNASGKTNFFDALRVLQGIGYGFTVDEIFNGKPRSANSEVWEPIRGGSSNLAYIKWDPEQGKVSRKLIHIEVQLRSPLLNGRNLRYSITLSARRGSVRQESLFVGSTPIFDSSPIDNSLDWPSFTVRYYAGQKGRQPHESFEKSRPVLTQMLKHRGCSERHITLIEHCTELLSNIQKLDPSPAVLREYAKAPFVKRMGERGENFAALVNAILSNEKTAAAYTSWLKQLTPTEMDEISILTGALQEPLFALKNRGEIFPAPVLSDGTLRFAAIAAAFFQPDVPEGLMIEEIENGIHPTRLRLLVELLKSQSGQSVPQAMVTTHSPIVLAWLNERDYWRTFFCRKNEETGATTIHPLTEVPHFLELVEKQPISELFAEGWLEGAL